MELVSNSVRALYPMALVFMAFMAMSAMFSTGNAEGSFLCFKDEYCLDHNCINKCHNWTQNPKQSYCSFTDETKCCCKLGDGSSSGASARQRNSDITIIGRGSGGRGGGRGGHLPGRGHGGGVPGGGQGGGIGVPGGGGRGRGHGGGEGDSGGSSDGGGRGSGSGRGGGSGLPGRGHGRGGGSGGGGPPNGSQDEGVLA